MTVVIPTHNRRRLLFRTLGSVLRQEDVRLQVVVVDDGSDDGSAEAVRSLGLGDVRVLRHESAKGVSAARNAGLAVAESPWVAFVDDDDLWAPGKLRAQLASLDDEPDARWSAVGACHVDRELRTLALHRPPLPQDATVVLLRENAIPGGGSGVLVCTDLARGIDGFDESLSIVADWDFYLRLSQRSPLAAVDDFLVAYHLHADSMLHDPGRFMRELLHMECKHRGADGTAPLQLDLSAWSVDLAWMAHRLGDRRTARSLLWRGVRRAGFVPVASCTARRSLRKLRGVLQPVDLPAEATAWLAVYA